VSEDYPDIEVSYWDGSSWIDIIDYVYDFEVRDAGIKKIPMLTLRLHNENGRFTKAAGSDALNMNDEIRVRADVRGSWDTIFQGNIYAFDPDQFIKGAPEPRSVLTVVARSKYGQRCLRDTITHPYHDQGWFAQEAIVDFLANPDSGTNTGITLNTDSGSILTDDFPTNPKKTTLLKAIQDACEKTGYLGWFDDTNGTLYLRKYRSPGTSLPTPSPSIHYDHSNGLLDVVPKKDIEDLKNYIFAWGSTDQGYPVLDYWTEHGVTRWGSGVAWDNGVFSGVLKDETALGIHPPVEGQDFIRVTAINAGQIGIRLKLQGADYVNPNNPSNYYLNLNADRLQTIEFEIGPMVAGGPFTATVYLKDNANASGWRTSVALLNNIWNSISWGVTTADHGAWNTTAGFDWSSIVTVSVTLDGIVNANEWFGLDALRFTGDGWSIDPFLYPDWNHPRYDSTSISNYGLSVHHHTDEEIKSFEDAYIEAGRILTENKDPYTRIRITEGAKTWIHPGNAVIVTIPTWDINWANYRVEEVIHRYNAQTKLLRTTVDLIAFYDEVATRKFQSEDVSVLWEPPK